MARKYKVVTCFRDDADGLFLDCISAWANSAADAKQTIRQENADLGLTNVETAVKGTKQADRIIKEYLQRRPGTR